MKSSLHLFSLFALLAVSAVTKIKPNPPGLAPEGHDPVACFTAGQPTRGFATIAAQPHGATFQFAAGANRTAFLAAPFATLLPTAATAPLVPPRINFSPSRSTRGQSPTAA